MKPEPEKRTDAKSDRDTDTAKRRTWRQWVDDGVMRVLCAIGFVILFLTVKICMGLLTPHTVKP